MTRGASGNDGGRRARYRHAKRNALIFGVLLVIVGGAAPGPFIGVFESLWSRIVDVPNPAKPPLWENEVPQLCAGFVLVVLTGLIGWRIGRVARDLVSASARQVVPSRPCRVLIMPLSAMDSDQVARFKDVWRRQAVETLGRRGSEPRRALADICKSVGAFEGWSWLQNLRATHKHLEPYGDGRTPRLEKVFVMVSRAEEDRPGSVCQYPEFIDIFSELVGPYFASNGDSAGGARHVKEMTQTLGPLNFEDHDEVYGALVERLDPLLRNYGSFDICVDVTGGQKPLSIAAAIATLNEAVHFSYVTQKGAVKFYDARIDVGLPDV